MSLSVTIARWRGALKALPGLARDVLNYVRFRRAIYQSKELLDRGVPLIEWVNPLQALERVHRHRFPDRPWPEQRELALELGPDGNALEILYLALICRVADPAAVFEIGTYEGRTANVMALHTSPACRIHTLDLPSNGKTETRFPIAEGDRKWREKKGVALGGRLGKLPRAEDNSRIVQRLGDSAAFDYSPYRGRMDLVFVDGAHSYDYVMSDVRNALAMLTPRGFILMHDFLTHAGVTLAANVLQREHEVFHVAGTSFAILFPQKKC